MKKQYLLLLVILGFGFYSCTTLVGVAANTAGSLAGDAVSSGLNTLLDEDIEFSNVNYQKMNSTNEQKGEIKITGNLTYKPSAINGIRFRNLSNKALAFTMIDNNDDYIGSVAGMIKIVNGSIESLEKNVLYEFNVTAEVPLNQWKALEKIKLAKLDMK